MSRIRPFYGVPLSGLIGAAIIAVSAFGCGGSGSGTTTGTTGTTGTASPYAGSYAGNFVDQNNTIGTVTVSVANDGTFSGVYNYPTPISFTGSVNSSGAGSLKDSQGSFTLQMGAAGKATLGGGVGTPVDGAFVTLAANPTGVFSGFSGLYSGTVHNTTLGKTGIIALSISSGGTVTGVDLFDVNGTPTLVSVTGTLSGSGQLSYVVNGVTVSGTVALSGATISGSLSESNGDSATLSVNQVGTD